jgi:acyl-homoserine lactone acylase PvdQ
MGAQATLREAGLWESPLGSNAWAFGKDTTAKGKGMLLGNPHFPWVGTSRFFDILPHLGLRPPLAREGGGFLRCCA